MPGLESATCLGVSQLFLNPKSIDHPEDFIYRHCHHLWRTRDQPHIWIGRGGGAREGAEDPPSAPLPQSPQPHPPGVPFPGPSPSPSGPLRTPPPAPALP